MQNKTLVVKSDIRGLLRFLSHQETMAMFVRALIRSGADMVYSGGFNPRPRVSMPLPRVTGLETMGDVLCVSVGEEFKSNGGFCEDFKRQLPGGCDIRAAEVYEGKKKYQAGGADYLFYPEERNFSIAKAKMEELVGRIDGGENLVIERTYGSTKPSKEIEVSNYIEGGEVEREKIRMRCKITPGGTIRYTEIMDLIGVGPESLARPVVRENIKWVNL